MRRKRKRSIRVSGRHTLTGWCRGVPVPGQPYTHRLGPEHSEKRRKLYDRIDCADEALLKWWEHYFETKKQAELAERYLLLAAA